MHDTCKKCNRELKDEESRERGFGPECWASLVKKTWKYVYSGVIVPDYDGINWRLGQDYKWQHQVIEHVENIGVRHDADFVMINLLGTSVIEHEQIGDNDLVYFAKITGEGNEWGGIVPKEKWIYGNNVNPMGPSYSYAPVFVMSEGGGSMAAIAAGSLERIPNGMGKNILWVSKMQEARYNVPLYAHPFLAEIIPHFEVVYEPIPKVESNWFHGDRETHEKFADWVFDSSAGLSIEEITGVPASKRYESNPIYRVAKILAENETVWGKQCEKLVHQMEDDLVEDYHHEVIGLETDSSHFEVFLDNCLDELNSDLLEYMRWQEAMMAADLKEHTFEN